MKSLKVVDASAFAAILFGEDEAQAVTEQLDLEWFANLPLERLRVDAASLARLAQTHHAELVTFDKQLAAAFIR